MKRTLAALVTTALALSAGTALIHPSISSAEERSVTLVGSLQDELGCSQDWQPSCARTRLAVDADGLYRGTFDVPEGQWEYKVALDGAWDESHPADNLPLVLQGAAKLEFTFDDATDKVSVRPASLDAAAGDEDRQLAQHSLRSSLTGEQFYFILTDRFANGDPSNDAGGLTSGPLQTGFDPTNKGFYHGGDIAGVRDKLDYIQGLGTTAIWLTPSFKNRPVQGSGDDASAGYHGYWTTDFTQIDPHLGTNEEMQALIKDAHQRGIKVFFDIITNHTADVIDYEGGTNDYISKEQRPYKDASGKEFDDAELAGKEFPKLDEKTSFPYVPTFRTESDRNVKVPGWLNDPTMYHNRGDSTWAGESSTYGDFHGLDDLFTERREVVDGMIDIYRSWAEMGIDGFRIDTVKHVNLEFWQEFSPRVLEAARKGNKDFFMFGEVFDGNPEYLSTFTTKGRLQSVLDFPFQGRAIDYAAGKATTGLRELFRSDDHYTDSDSNAYQLVKFTGNHDMGRAAMMLAEKGFSGDDLLARVKLSNELMFLSRGHAVVYYGDEQGFIGAGGDKDARQDMFQTKTAQYAKEEVLGGQAGVRERYDTNHPLYQQIARLAALRKAHPALVDGAQIHRYASGEAGVYAFSRIKAGENVEYLVVGNNATEPKSVRLLTYGGTFDVIHGGKGQLAAGPDDRLAVTVPALSTMVLKAKAPIAARNAAPQVSLTQPSSGANVGGRAEIVADVRENAPVQTTFAVRPLGTTKWQVLGTDDNAPYRVFHDVTGYARGTVLEYRVIAKDTSGNVSVSASAGIVGEGSSPAGDDSPEPGGPVTQPAAVSVPGSHNSEMGCDDDWAPACDQAQLSLDEHDSIWKGTFDSIPQGSYEYKAAINRSWDENYGAAGQPAGANLTYDAPGQKVTFYYDHARHYVTSDAQGPIITAAGSMQEELGCAKDWDPACMAPWLIDPDGDGVYTWSSTALPAGNYEMKVAHGLSWDENYGAGGAEGGDNVAFAVPKAGTKVTISYTLATHEIQVSTSEAGVAPDLKTAKAYWLTPELIAWPNEANPSKDQFRLAWAHDGGLAVDAEDITGGDQTTLTVDPAGLPDAVVTQYPHLKGYVALRLDQASAAKAAEILKGQVAVGRFAPDGSVKDATGVQIAGVLDSLYVKAAEVTLGVSQPKDAVVRLWAPTAHQVSLLVWPEGRTDAEPVTQAMQFDQSTGVWEAKGKPVWGAFQYLFEVTVFVPSTGKVEQTRVTDPYSVGLTLDSKRSVNVDLTAANFKPEGWDTSTGPKLASAVDQSIYELHVRDFSISDESLPEKIRGSYLAFSADGAGHRHLTELAKAGLNTVHLLPTFDIATIEEDPAEQTEPNCDLASYASDSREQQACVSKQADTDAFNWGYDPFHYMTPEGSYTSTPENADGGRRSLEFRQMVKGLHDVGLRVVLDQVYNHTAQSGLGEKSVLDKVVPGYYHRLDAKGAIETSTCCENVATEHMMAQKLMVDSIVVWARDYRVDGFRFDLMGHHSTPNMRAIRRALDELTPEKDGVDGKAITLYGEGWDFGEVSGNARFEQAIQGQLGGTGIGTFNDRLRDGVRGGGPFDDDPRTERGFATTGASANDVDLVQIGLAGNLRDFTLRSQQTGEIVKGSQIDYNGAPAGYADEPDEVVNYVDAHDNETLFDTITLKVPAGTPMEERVRLNTLALSTVALSQGVSFWHAGSDMLRSKSLDRDSYNSGDWFNLLDFTMQDNGFGRGLPPEGKNGDKWGIMAPLLADPANKPSPEQIRAASAAAQDLLRLRASTPLFRLASADAIREKLTFPVSGTEQGSDQVIVMHIDDTRGKDMDPKLDQLVAVFNASGKAIDQRVPGLEGAQLVQSDVQAGGSDARVKQSTWNAQTATAHVPAHTVAVFWLPQGDQGRSPQPTPAPTDEPTVSPTEEPTVSPQPTARPTDWPSDRPKPGMPRTGC